MTIEMTNLGMIIALHMLLEIFLKIINMMYESCFKITRKVIDEIPGWSYNNQSQVTGEVGTTFSQTWVYT